MNRVSFFKNIALRRDFKLISYPSLIRKGFVRLIHSDDSNDENIILTRLMLANDGNIMGFLHGGVNLQFAEKSGSLACKNYLNKKKSEINNPILCRMEHTNFISPGIIGDILLAESKIDFTSEHSMRVCTDVSGLKVLGDKTPISKSVLWYVNSEEGSDGIRKVVSVPICPKLSKNTIAFEQYNINKEKRLSKMKDDMDIKIPRGDFILNPSAPRYSVSRNSICFHYTLSPSDYSSSGYMYGGNLLKILDEATGFVAFRYINNICSTVRVEDVNFYSPVTSKEMLKIYAFPIFTSSRSIELKAIAVIKKSDKEQLVCSSTVTYVSINKDGSLNEFPQLLIESESERKLFDERYKIYAQRKKSKN